MRARLARAAALVRPAVPVLKLLGFAAAIGIVIVIGVTAARDLPDRGLDWWLLLPALLATGVWWVLLAGGWAVIAGGGWSRAHVAQWCQTQALRYLPGGIWAPVSRVAVVGGTALDRVATVAAENLVALGAALTVGGIGLAAAGRWAWVPLVLAAGVPALLARFVASRTRVDPDRVLRATAGYLVAFTGYVGAAVLVQAAVSGWHDSAVVAGAAAVAWAAGLLVIVAPSGLGAREFAYVALLEGAFARGDASAGAVTMRLVTVAAELIVLVAVGRPPGATRRREGGDTARGVA